MTPQTDLFKPTHKKGKVKENDPCLKLWEFIEEHGSIDRVQAVQLVGPFLSIRDLIGKLKVNGYPIKDAENGGQTVNGRRVSLWKKA